MKPIHNTVRYIDSSNKRLNRSHKPIGTIPQLRSIGKTTAEPAVEGSARGSRKRDDCFFEKQFTQIKIEKRLEYSPVDGKRNTNS
jgi:hypothetical protein